MFVEWNTKSGFRHLVWCGHAMFNWLQWFTHSFEWKYIICSVMYHAQVNIADLPLDFSMWVGCFEDYLFFIDAGAAFALKFAVWPSSC